MVVAIVGGRSGELEVRAARIAVSAGFFMFGLGFATWAVHILTLVRRLDLDPAILGLALLNVGLGAVITQPITGRLIGRIGSRAVTRVMLVVFMATLLAPILAWNTPLFFAGTLLLGFASGAANVAINTQATEIERALGRPTMSWFHGFFSLGALAGASIGGAIISAGLQDGRGAIGLVAILLVGSLVAVRYLLPSAPVAAPLKDASRRRFGMPGGMVLGLALLLFFANMVEGAVGDWSSLYLLTVRHLSDGSAASGYAIFSLAMAACRLAGGPVVARLGDKRTVFYGGLVMAVGVAVVVLSPWDFVSPFGFGLVAIGAANAYPVMISAASRAPGTTAGSGVAAAATGALLGFLIGPPMIGFIAHGFGLATAMGLLGVVGLMLVVGSALIKWPASVAGAG